MPESAGILQELTIHLMGSFQIDVHSKPLDLSTWRRQVKHLVKLLALAPGHRLDKEQIFEALWPDQDPSRTDNSLRQVLYLGRKGFDRAGLSGRQVIHQEEGWIELNPDGRVWIDVEQFEQTGSSARRQKKLEVYEAALALYAGELLPEDRYEDWATYRRETLRSLYLQLIKDLAHLYDHSQKYENAIDWLNRGLERDPTDEDLHASLMQDYAWLGLCSKALRQYDRMQEILKKELDLKPNPALQKLHQSILDDCFPPNDPALPALSASVQPRHNLPIPRTSLIGRAQDVQKVQDLIAHASLVTLTGSGGVGKTRLSLQVAENVLDHFADGVWYIELAALSDPVLVPQQVATTLGVRTVPGQPILDSLVSFLHDRQILLVLDNCEHLRDACAQLVDILQKTSPQLKVLTSSREPLGVAGEVSYRVPSLLFPAPGKQLSPHNAMEYAALQLFVDRACLVRPGFQVTAGNTAALARTCQRLDGIPLAIELAAARVGVLTLDQLASRLDNAFRLLAHGNRSALPRQQTLRATIDWSYALLDRRERLLFQRLAVFAGDCSLEAAETICSGAGLEAGDILDLLASLVAKSMVMVDFQRDDDVTRYRLLDTVHQYAHEKLLDSGESASLNTNHLDFFLGYIETNVPKLNSADWTIWKGKLEADHSNLTQALEWSLRNQTSLEAGLRFFLAMLVFWGSRYYQEPIEWFKRAAVQCQNYPEISPSLYAEFLGWGSHRLELDNPQTALSGINLSVEIARQLGPEGQENLVKRLLDKAESSLTSNDSHQTLAAFTEAKTLLQQIGPENYPDLKGWIAGLGAKLANLHGKHQEAIELARECIQIYEKLGLVNHIDQFICMGDAYTGLGAHDQARAYYRQALTQADEFGDLRKGGILCCLGSVNLSEGNLEGALGYCQQSLKEAYTIPDNNVMAFNLDLAARIRVKQGLSVQAAHLSGLAHTLYERQGRLSLEHSALDSILPGWQEESEYQAIKQAYEAGKSMAVDEAIDYALHNL